MFVVIFIVYDCFHATVELNSCDRDLVVDKPKIFAVWPFVGS